MTQASYDQLLLLLISPSSTFLECQSNQRIRSKMDSRVPRCGFSLTPSNQNTILLIYNTMIAMQFGILRKVTENGANASLIEKVIKENRFARYINVMGSI